MSKTFKIGQTVTVTNPDKVNKIAEGKTGKVRSICGAQAVIQLTKSRGIVVNFTEIA